MLAEDSAPDVKPKPQVLIIYRTLPGCARTVSALIQMNRVATKAEIDAMVQRHLDEEKLRICSPLPEFNQALWETDFIELQSAG